MVDEYISIIRKSGGQIEYGSSLAYIALIVDENVTHSKKIGYYAGEQIFVSDPTELLAFIDEIGIDKLADIQNKYGEPAREIPMKELIKKFKLSEDDKQEDMTYVELHYIISTWDRGFDKLKQLYTQIDTFTGITESEKEMLKDEISKRLQDMEYFFELGKDVGDILGRR
jgi:hypothetical protein